MKKIIIILPLLCMSMTLAAQENITHHHADDSTDVFFRHLQLNELTVTGVTGDTKLKHATAPVSIVTPQVLKATASTNIIDAIARQPGISQLTTGSSISKPIIRGLGYNRVVVMSEGVRQEGQQWGDEHGVEVDGSSVNSVETLDSYSGVKPGDAKWTKEKDGVHFVSGATYSSNAVCDLVWYASTAVRDYLAASAEKKEGE